MTRAEAVTFASEQYPELATVFGVTATDTAAGWKVAVDRAFRQLTGATTGPVADADAEDAELLLRYFALVRLYAAAVSRVDVSVGAGDVAGSKKYSQAAASIRTLLDDVKAEVEAADLAAGAASWTQARVTLDFLEPADDESAGVD